ncbi:S-norcoclaurine synthase 1 [Acorus gramineus]|uniref:S-norcoclaurine synthase 1 n=1 Tax=Acorus gramineus TaxID=55184 RepID=A0AAV9B828_ACOGR|nr:S-norcoclaurine synthase 1 [Acorus gramineus]
MAKNLGVGAETLIEKLVLQQVRINYYPPCPQSDKVLGLSPHSDTDTLTILLQINEVQGLQIKKDDNWVPIAPLPDSFIINIGDVMEILSNGKYKSIKHRGTIDPLKERLSIATFHSPNYDASIGPLKEITRDEALASMKMEEIPNRYIRPEIEAEPTIGDDVHPEISTVDLSGLLDERSSEEESEKLHFACEEWGFFHLVNHGVSGQVLEKMKTDLKEFFRQPLEVKEAHAQLPGDIEGYGQAFVVSDKQKLDWADMIYLKIRPFELRNMRFWPSQPPSFKETLDHYTLEIQKVADELVGAMAKNLGVSAETLIEKLVFQQVRINYYPPCPQSDKVLGLSPHSDTDTLTILLQINEVQGLQIKKDDNWVPVVPLPDSFIINIGDMMEASYVILHRK